MAVRKWKPGTVANEKHFWVWWDSLLQHLILKNTFKTIYLQWCTKEIISIVLFFVNNKSVLQVKELRKKKQGVGSQSWAPNPDTFRLDLFSCLLLKTFVPPFLTLAAAVDAGWLGHSGMPYEFLWLKCYSGIFVVVVKAKLKGMIYCALNRAGVACWSK